MIASEDRTEKAEDADPHEDYSCSVSILNSSSVRENQQKNSVNMDRMLNTIRLFASVTNANLGKIRTAPVAHDVSLPHKPMILVWKLGHTYCQPIGTEGERLLIVILETIRPSAEVDRVDEHEDDIESVDQTAAEDC